MSNTQEPQTESERLLKVKLTPFQWAVIISTLEMVSELKVVADDPNPEKSKYLKWVGGLSAVIMNQLERQL